MSIFPLGFNFFLARCKRESNFLLLKILCKLKTKFQQQVSSNPHTQIPAAIDRLFLHRGETNVTMKSMKAVRERMARGMQAVREGYGGRSPNKKWVGAQLGLDVQVAANKGVHVTNVLHSSPAALSGFILVFPFGSICHCLLFRLLLTDFCTGCIAIGDIICSIDARPVSSETSTYNPMMACSMATPVIMCR